MPKYTPTIEDTYKITPCVICGRDTGNKHKDTCCWQCDNEKSYLDEWMDCDFMENDLDDLDVFERIDNEIFLRESTTN